MAEAVEEALEQPGRGIKDSAQPRFPWRPGLGLLFGGAGWYWAGQAISTVLLPAKIATIDPAGKVNAVALISAATMVLSIVAGIVGGALSDRTRSRFGSRTPWIFWCTVVGSLALVVFAFSGNFAVTVASWLIYAILYNMMLAAGSAWQPDMIAHRWYGTASTMYGTGHQAALWGAQVIASMFLTRIPTAAIIIMASGAALTLISLAIVREPSNKDVPLETPGHKGIASYFSTFLPARNGGRDYWLAAAARFLYMVPGGIGTYRLYELTDYMHQSTASAGYWMSVISVVGLIIGIVFCVVSGPISDAVKSIKIPLGLAIILIGAPCMLPFFIATPEMYVVYIAMSSIGGGVFSALDQAIMISVLPDPHTAAKDLAFLNSCGVVGMLVAPLLADWIISVAGYQFLFPMGFFVLALAAVCVLFIKKVK